MREYGRSPSKKCSVTEHAVRADSLQPLALLQNLLILPLQEILQNLYTLLAVYTVSV